MGNHDTNRDSPAQLAAGVGPRTGPGCIAQDGQVPARCDVTTDFGQNVVVQVGACIGAASGKNTARSRFRAGIRVLPQRIAEPRREADV